MLVYALNASGLAAAGSSQHDTLSSLYQLALLDRSTSMRQMIGELARAKQLTYRETSDKYGALIAAARKDVSLGFLPGGRRFRDPDHAASGRADGAPAERPPLRRAHKRRTRRTRRKAQASTHCGHDARIDAAPGGEPHVREDPASSGNARVLRRGRRRGAAHRTRHAGIEGAGRREGSRDGRNASPPETKAQASKVNRPPA